MGYHRGRWRTTLITAALLVACHDRAGPAVESAEGSPSRIPDSYELIDLGTLEGASFSYPMSVNSRSEVVGMVSNPYDYYAYRGFYWNEEDGMADLGLPVGYDSVWADDISDRGVVVGTLSSYTEPRRGFLWERGEYELIEPPQGGTFTEAWGINRDGHIVGATDFTPGGYQAYLLRDGEFTDLGRAEGGYFSVATAINRGGDIIGYGDNGAGDWVGLLWLDDGAWMVDLSTVLSVPDFIPYGISRGGHLAGHSWTLDHAILVRPGGEAVDLGSLAGPTGYSEGWAVNATEQVVGYSSTAEGLAHAFVWEDGEMVDLNDRLDPGAEAELLEATSINDNGEIAAYGMTQGELHAFLLRPR